MIGPIDTIKTYALFAMAALIAVLTLATYQYRTLYKATSTAYGMLNESVKRQNAEATERYDALKKDRDTRQEDLDKALAQNQTDKDLYEKQLVALRGELAARPTLYRVRLVPGSCGSGGGHAASQAPANTGAGPQTDAAAFAVLDPQVGQRLDALKLDMESLQGDFNVCRAHALAVEAAVKK